MTSWPLLSIERLATGPDDRAGADSRPGDSKAPARPVRGRVVACGLLLFVVHVFCMIYAYGHRPPAPVIGDEVTINDPAIALSRGQGLIAPSFKDSVFGFDKLYAHFPPVYAYVESIAFRISGVSVYSLRLTTTVTDILAAAVFVAFLYWMCHSGLADSVTALITAMLYLLNASVIALHRIARMEPLVELFAMIGLWLAVAAVSNRRTSSHSVVGLSIAACVASGIAMVTHPEALTAVLPVLLLAGIRRDVTWRDRLICLFAFVVTPAVVWLAAYGSKSIEALRQMWTMVRFTPGPGVFRFAHEFTREDHRNVGQGMRASLFLLCLALFVGVVVRWWRLERLRDGGGVTSQTDEIRLAIARAFGVATLISLILLIWFVGASISRYEVMFPVWLLGLPVALQGVSWTPRTRIVAAFSAAVIVGELVATGVYLWRPEAFPVDLDPHRFDAVLAQIPRGDSVAATPMLWLAFQQQNRPFTLLYWRFDGREKWKRENGGNPLRQFDAVVVDESFIDDYREDAPYAAQGRKEYRYVVGSDVVHLFLPR